MLDGAKDKERRTLSTPAPAKPRATGLGPVILFTAAGVRFGVEASQVQEIREGDHGAITGKLKGARYIDFALQVGLGHGILERLVVLKPGVCVLGVSEVERMATPPRAVGLPGIFQGAERQWYRGLLLLDNEVVPLIRADYWRTTGTGGPGYE